MNKLVLFYFLTIIIVVLPIFKHRFYTVLIIIMSLHMIQHKFHTVLNIFILFEFFRLFSLLWILILAGMLQVNVS